MPLKSKKRMDEELNSFIKANPAASYQLYKNSFTGKLYSSHTFYTRRAGYTVKPPIALSEVRKTLTTTIVSKPVQELLRDTAIKLQRLDPALAVVSLNLGEVAHFSVETKPSTITWEEKLA